MTPLPNHPVCQMLVSSDPVLNSESSSSFQSPAAPDGSIAVDELVLEADEAEAVC